VRSVSRERAELCNDAVSTAKRDILSNETKKIIMSVRCVRTFVRRRSWSEDYGKARQSPSLQLVKSKYFQNTNVELKALHGGGDSEGTVSPLST
jgi:hypothetical protein